MDFEASEKHYICGNSEVYSLMYLALALAIRLHSLTLRPEV